MKKSNIFRKIDIKFLRLLIGIIFVWLSWLIWGGIANMTFGIKIFKEESDLFQNWVFKIPQPFSKSYLLILRSLIMAFLFCLVYAIIYKGIPGKNALLKGLIYGIIVFSVFKHTETFNSIIVMNWPISVQLVWWVIPFVSSIIGGPIMSYIYEKI